MPAFLQLRVELCAHPHVRRLLYLLEAIKPFLVALHQNLSYHLRLLDLLSILVFFHHHVLAVRLHLFPVGQVSHTSHHPGHCVVNTMVLLL